MRQQLLLLSYLFVLNLIDADLSLFPQQCEQRLRSAGLWESNDWVFLTGNQRYSDGLVLPVVWAEENATCHAAADLDPNTRLVVGAESTPGSASCRALLQYDYTINVLLSGVNHIDFYGDDALQYNILIPRALYVVNVADWTDDREVNAVRLLGKALTACDARATLLHYADERAVMTWFYDSWPLILRTYFSEDMLSRWSDRLMVLPMGYTSGLPRSRNDADPLLKANERVYTWAFFGDSDPFKTTRPAMVDAFSQVDGGRTHYSVGFLGSNTVSVSMIGEEMRKTLFCPAPAGYSSPDTFRFYEALESGCIPIVDALGFSSLPEGLTQYIIAPRYFRRFLNYLEITYLQSMNCTSSGSIEGWCSADDENCWSENGFSFLSWLIETTNWAKTAETVGIVCNGELSAELVRSQQEMIRWWTTMKYCVAKSIFLRMRENQLQEQNIQ